MSVCSGTFTGAEVDAVVARAERCIGSLFRDSGELFLFQLYGSSSCVCGRPAPGRLMIADSTLALCVYCFRIDF